MTFSNRIYSLYNRFFGALFIAFLSFQIYFGIVPGWKNINSDFPNYYVAAQLLFEDKSNLDLYNNDWFQKEIKLHAIDAVGKFSPFPPPTAFILAPISFLNPLAAKKVWLIINIGLIFLIAASIKKITELNYRDSLLLIMSTGIALANTLMLGQVYLLLLLSILWAYIYLNANKKYAPGMLLGAGISVKYFPVIFLPALIYMREWKTVITILVSVLIINLAALLIFGTKTYQAFFDTVFFQHLNGNLEGQSPWAFAFQSWNALAHNLFKFDPVLNPNPVYNSKLCFLIFKYGIQMIIFSLGAWIFWKIKKQPHFLETSIILISIMLLYLTPAGATYHNLLLILPIALFLKLNRRDRENYFTIWIILICSNVLIGLIPLLQNKVELFSSNLTLAFYRLWLYTLIFVSICYWLIISNRELNQFRKA